ncbi:hypothetical protein LMG27174_06634 [Paraburkholderia rhynchosiae]|uniref:Uncharacterized protein n=1 Tax=Paraburkholderia rhynchosiae TaxID=487049 RepID=A0A2N7W2B5_9BURK|nr:hypothetical protein C0Z16_32175 [Paraburkholderia rhynchosiae]CAB3740306.1 hypothetical protein LMG27174_06634 [Paraburkholderia rhynchosiae]
MAIDDTPLEFVVTRDDLFTFTHGELFGTCTRRPTRLVLMSGSGASRKRYSTAFAMKAESCLRSRQTVIISEGYARTAAEAAYDMRACLRRQIAKAEEAYVRSRPTD